MLRFRDRQFPGKAAPAWARRRVGGQGPAVDDGYCALFSLDWWLVCLAAFALMFAIGGDVSVVAYLGACAWVTGRNLGLAARTLFRNWLLLLLPALCMLSTFWSDQPAVSLKQSAELIATVLFAIVICGRIRGRELAAALLFAGSLMCLLSLLYQRNALGSPLVGLMGSKNQMAFLSEILLASAVAAAAEPKNILRLRLFAVAGVSLGLLDVVLARSAGAWVTSVVALTTFAVLSLFSRISLGARVVVVVLAVLAMAPFAIAYKDVVQTSQVVQTKVLHKDATLTGRTALWTAAKSVIAESPTLGHGYDAFWQQGNLDAEALYRTNGIASRTGFNFHNQFLDTWVELGEVGLCALVATLIYVAAGSIWRATTSPSLSAAYMASLLVALYSRLPVESVLIGAWNLYTFLWLGVGVSVYALGDQPARAVTRSPVRRIAGKASWRASHDRLRTAPRTPARSDQML